MDPEKQKLLDLALHVHRALRMLKMGESATISCGTKFPHEEVSQYVVAYAFHKKKWFSTKFDPTSEIIYATRSPPPPWEKEEIEEEPDAE